jgi:hypothetical protein
MVALLPISLLSTDRAHVCVELYMQRGTNCNISFSPRASTCRINAHPSPALSMAQMKKRRTATILPQVLHKQPISGLLTSTTQNRPNYHVSPSAAPLIIFQPRERPRNGIRHMCVLVFDMRDYGPSLILLFRYVGADYATISCRNRRLCSACSSRDCVRDSAEYLRGCPRCVDVISDSVFLC